MTTPTQRPGREWLPYPLPHNPILEEALMDAYEKGLYPDNAEAMMNSMGKVSYVEEYNIDALWRAIDHHDPSIQDEYEAVDRMKNQGVRKRDKKAGIVFWSNRVTELGMVSTAAALLFGAIALLPAVAIGAGLFATRVATDFMGWMEEYGVKE